MLYLFENYNSTFFLKIDMKSADPERIAKQLQRVFDIEPEEIMQVLRDNKLPLRSLILR